MRTEENDQSDWVVQSYTTERRMTLLFNQALLEQGEETYNRFSDEDIFNASSIFSKMISLDQDITIHDLLGLAYNIDNWNGLTEISLFIDTVTEAIDTLNQQNINSLAHQLILTCNQKLSVDKIIAFLVHYSANTGQGVPVDGVYDQEYGAYRPPGAFTKDGVYYPALQNITDSKEASKAIQEHSKDIKSMTKADRLVFLLEETFRKIDLNIFDIFSMTDLYILAATLVLWIGSHFFGVGEIIDGILFVLLWGQLGWDAWYYLKILYHSLKTALFASSLQEIDNAATDLAPLTREVALDIVLGYLLHKIGGNKEIIKAIGKDGNSKSLQIGKKAKTGLKDTPPIPKKELVKLSTVSKEDLENHLKFLEEKGYIKPGWVQRFHETGEWPENQPIPARPEVLTPEGDYNWKLAPHGGYRLDAKTGEPIKELYSPKEGEIIDRYGDPRGHFASPVEDPENSIAYEKRSLPYVEGSQPYHRYRFKADMSKFESILEDADIKTRQEIVKYMKDNNLTYDKLVHRGPIAPAFGEPGGGIQYQFGIPINMLLKSGILEEIP